MINLSLTKIAVSAGGMALALTTGAGVASADPMEPIINELAATTCSYDQANTALHTENPMAATYFDESPPNQEFLRIFLSSPREKRVKLLNDGRNNPGIDVALPIFQQMMRSCHKY